MHLGALINCTDCRTHWLCIAFWRVIAHGLGRYKQFSFFFFVRAGFRFYFQFKFNLNAVASWQLPVAILPVAILPCWRFAGWPLLGSADSDATRAEATLCQPTSSSTYSGGAIGVVLGVRVGAGVGAGPLCVHSDYFGVGHIKKTIAGGGCRRAAIAASQRLHKPSHVKGLPPLPQRDSAPLVYYYLFFQVFIFIILEKAKSKKKKQNNFECTACNMLHMWQSLKRPTDQ